MIELHIPNMSCGHCVRNITEAVHTSDPQAQVTADLAGHLVRVETQVSAEVLAATLTQAGYPPG